MNAVPAVQIVAIPGLALPGGELLLNAAVLRVSQLNREVAVGVDNVLCLLGCNQVLHRTREDRGSRALGRKSLVFAEGTAEVAIPFQYN